MPQANQRPIYASQAFNLSVKSHSAIRKNARKGISCDSVENRTNGHCLSGLGAGLTIPSEGWHSGQHSHQTHASEGFKGM